MNQAAINILEIAKDVCDTNAPINEREGRVDQAAYERQNSQAYAAAIELLKAQS